MRQAGKTIGGILTGLAVLWTSAAGAASTATQSVRFYFPPPGQAIENQDRRRPDEVGLNPAVIDQLRAFIGEHPDRGRRSAPRWALWRHGHLVHVEGDFHQRVDVASLRKTWHALTVGAAIRQGKIPSLDQKISAFETDLTGNDADATWRHVITQSAGFDYPYDDHPDFKPGEMWTYSDHNPVRLCRALARVYGKKDYHDSYAEVLKQAYFDAIGMDGWSVVFTKDGKTGKEDGVRLSISLEHMGRLGLLVLARGTWEGRELIPQWFVEALETKQTRGMKVNYNGPYDGIIGLDPRQFPECPYGFMTWVNTDGDHFPGADKAWAWGSGAGGTKIMWNRNNGIVFAGVSIAAEPGTQSIPHIIERNIAGPNRLAVGR